MTKQDRDKLVAVLITLVFHLLFLLFLFATTAKTYRTGEFSFVADADGQIPQKLEEEKSQQEELIKEIAQQQINEQLTSFTPNTYKSIAVNAQSQSNNSKDNQDNNKQIKDNSSEDKNKQENNNSKESGVDVVSSIESIQKNSNTAESGKGRGYSGPSVLSWLLDGREAKSLPVPAYKCLGEGKVVVRIEVDREGYVKRASVIGGQSSSSSCHREEAVKAAVKARFDKSLTAPEIQVGEIVYIFVGQ